MSLLHQLFSASVIFFGLSTMTSCDRLEQSKSDLNCDGSSVPIPGRPLPSSSAGLSSAPERGFIEFESRPMKTAVTKNYMVHIRGSKQGIQDLSIVQRSDGKPVSIASSEKSLNETQSFQIYGVDSLDGDRIVLINNSKIQVVEIRPEGFKLVFEQAPDLPIRMMIQDGERVVFVSSNYASDSGNPRMDPYPLGVPKGNPHKYPKKNCRPSKASAQAEDQPTSLDQERRPPPPPPKTVVHVLDLKDLKLDSSAVWEHFLDFENWNRSSKNLYLNAWVNPACEPNIPCTANMEQKTFRFATSPLQAPVQVKDKSEILDPEQAFLSRAFDDRFTRHIVGSKYRVCQGSQHCKIIEVLKSKYQSGGDVMRLGGPSFVYVPMDAPFGDILPVGDAILESNSVAYRLIDKAFKLGAENKWP